MSSVRLSGNASGTGIFTIASPNSNTDRTLNIPDATTTIVGTDATQSLTNKSFDSASVPTVTGTAPLYFCRAWVNFNGTGTVAIRASGNVTSITDNGTGNYTLNFSSAMPDVNYAVTQGGGEVQTAALYSGSTAARIMQPGPLGTTGVQIFTGYQFSSSALQDYAFIYIAIFR